MQISAQGTIINGEQRRSWPGRKKVLTRNDGATRPLVHEVSESFACPRNSRRRSVATFIVVRFPSQFRSNLHTNEKEVGEAGVLGRILTIGAVARANQDIPADRSLKRNGRRQWLSVGHRDGVEEKEATFCSKRKIEVEASVAKKKKGNKKIKKKRRGGRKRWKRKGKGGTRSIATRNVAVWWGWKEGRKKKKKRKK